MNLSDKRLFSQRQRYACIISILECVSVLMLAVLVGSVIETTLVKPELSYLPITVYAVLTLFVVSFTILYKAVSKRKGANGFLLPPYTVSLKSGDYLSLIEKINCLRKVVPFGESSWYARKTGKYCLHIFLFHESSFDPALYAHQERNAIQIAEGKKYVAKKMSRAERMRHIELKVLMVDNMSSDLFDIVQKNAAKSEYLISYEFRFVIDLSAKKLLIPAFWGDDISSGKKYAFCVNEFVKLLQVH